MVGDASGSATATRASGSGGASSWTWAKLTSTSSPPESGARARRAVRSTSSSPRAAGRVDQVLAEDADQVGRQRRVGLAGREQPAAAPPEALAVERAARVVERLGGQPRDLGPGRLVVAVGQGVGAGPDRGQLALGITEAGAPDQRGLGEVGEVGGEHPALGVEQAIEPHRPGPAQGGGVVAAMTEEPARDPIGVLDRSEPERLQPACQVLAHGGAEYAPPP